MTMEKARRVMWRLRERTRGNTRHTLAEIRSVIMEEVGTDERTIKRMVAVLLEMKLLKRTATYLYEDKGDFLE